MSRCSKGLSVDSRYLLFPGKMLFQRSGSYYEDFRRTKGVPSSEPSDPKRLLTDRSAYISYLEVQLERVSTACLSVQGFRYGFRKFSFSLHITLINFDIPLAVEGLMCSNRSCARWSRRFVLLARSLAFACCSLQSHLNQITSVQSCASSALQHSETQGKEVAGSILSLQADVRRLQSAQVCLSANASAS